MGATRRSRWRPPGRRVVAGAGFALVAVAGAVACDPGGLGTAAVAYTTGQTATRELKRHNIDVQWLSCTSNYGNNNTAHNATPTASETTVADVDCQGQTKDGKDITVTGKVTRAVDGACVRGDLTAKVGGRTVFHVSGLGDCTSTPSPIQNNPGGGSGPGATVTVTVTRTIWCKGDPQCWPVQGK